MREIAISEKPKTDYSLHLPLYYRLDDDSRYALELAYRRVTGYKKKLIPPGSSYGLPDFDAAKEMHAPEEERHMRRDA